MNLMLPLLSMHLILVELSWLERAWESLPFRTWQVRCPVCPRSNRIPECDIHFVYTPRPGVMHVHTDFIYVGFFFFSLCGGKQTFLRNATVRPSRIELSRKSHIHVGEVSRNCVGRVYLVAVTGSTWQLRGLRGYYDAADTACECGTSEQTMQHLLRCPLLGNECSLRKIWRLL